MSTLKQQHTAISEVTEASVAAWLQAHPDFFERHTSLLATLKLPHSPGSAAVSLVERQVTVLRQKNGALERKLKDLVDVARSNDQLAARIHTLALRLLETRDRSDVVRVLEEELRLSFHADHAVLVVFEGPSDPSAAGERFLRVVPRDEPRLAPFRTFLQSDAPRCGQVRDSQRNFLFGPDSVDVGSVALVPLGARCELGFLAIGSRDADHYHPGKSVEFLSRLAELVGAALRARD